MTTSTLEYIKQNKKQISGLLRCARGDGACGEDRAFREVVIASYFSEAIQSQKI